MIAPLDEAARLDPRKRRTRVALQRALEQLLATKDFESISVQDISEHADLNRATFYAHYPDKFALLECMVGSRFTELLTKRNITADGGCGAAMEGLALAVCDYLALMMGDGERHHQLEPHIEAAVIGAVRRMMLMGLEQHVPHRKDLTHEMMATAASWAMYGAAKEWLRAPRRRRPEDFLAVIRALVAPILEPPAIVRSTGSARVVPKRIASRQRAS